MTEVEVRYPSGCDLLNAYWGYLCGGGLELESAAGLGEGQSVLLKVSIDDAGSAAHRVRGRVVRVGGAAGEQTFVAFEPGQPEASKLLVDALFCHQVRVPAGIRATGGHRVPYAGLICNLSDRGCRLRLGDRARRFHVGQHVVVEAPTFGAHGCVVWRDADSCMVMFNDDTTGEVRSRIAGCLANEPQNRDEIGGA